MKLKYLVAAAATLASSSAFAGVSGNVGGVSEYMFRGVSQGNNAAVQGGIDLETDSGFYLGGWGSNIDWGVGGTEVDLYGGFANSIGDLGYDLGVIYYWYPEEDEQTTVSVDTVEFYGSLSYGFLSAGVAYTDDYFGTDEEAFYYSASASVPVSDTVSFDAAVGLSDGDGIEAGFGESSYVDYSVGLSKAVTDELSVSMAFIMTDLDDDDPKFVVGFGYGFDM